MTDFNKRVEFQLSCQWTDVTTLLIVWFVISIVLKGKKVKKNNRVDTIIQGTSKGPSKFVNISSCLPLADKGWVGLEKTS